MNFEQAYNKTSSFTNIEKYLQVQIDMQKTQPLLEGQQVNQSIPVVKEVHVISTKYYHIYVLP